MLYITCSVSKLILELGSSFPLRSLSQFVYLVCGLIMNPGHVTDALVGIAREKHWSSSYKWLSGGSWSYLSLARTMCKAACRCFRGTVYLGIDDTIIYRSSELAPASKIHHEHGNKCNRSDFVLGQCLVVLGACFHLGKLGTHCLPLLSRLTPTTGNTGKLVAARVLWRAVRSIFENARVYLLVDAWYMKEPLIAPMLDQGVDVIGQIRIDSALFELPAPKKKKCRGRPRKYGKRIRIEEVKKLRFEKQCMYLYNTEWEVSYRTEIVKARFLKGAQVRVVWTRLKKITTGEITNLKLLLSTDTNLSAVEIIDAYSRRWSIETLFREMKHNHGMQKSWQQHRQTFSRWIQIQFAAYFIPAYLLVQDHVQARAIAHFMPWRRSDDLTVGLVQEGLKRIFRTSEFPSHILKLAKIHQCYRPVKRADPERLVA